MKLVLFIAYIEALIKLNGLMDLLIHTFHCFMTLLPKQWRIYDTFKPSLEPAMFIFPLINVFKTLLHVCSHTRTMLQCA